MLTHLADEAGDSEAELKLAGLGPQRANETSRSWSARRCPDAGRLP